MDDITPNNDANVAVGAADGGTGAKMGAKMGADMGTDSGAKATTDNLIITRPRAPAEFDLQSEFKPAGDQPDAIAELIAGIKEGERDQVLLGVTGSGKTFTAAHVIKAIKRPTLILAPNKVANSDIQDSHKDIVWGNVIFGGVIGYAVDRSSGAACHYPSSVTVTLEELRCRTRVLRKILDLRSSPSAPPRSPTRERPRRCPLRKGTLAGQSDVSDTPSFKSWQDSGRVRPRHK